MLKPNLATHLTLLAATVLLLSGASSPTVPAKNDIPADAQTPKIAGRWTFSGCEEGIVWDAHHFEMVEEGLICMWRGHDERGRPAQRTENFAANGERVKTE